MAKKTGSNLVAYGLIALLIVGLAGFGLSDFGGGVRSIGGVGETEIPTDRYARELQGQLRALSEQRGSAVTLAEARETGIEDQVLARLLADAALEEEARQIGVSVGDARIRDEILAIDAFRGPDGQFDREGYEFALSQQGLSAGAFEEEVRADLSRSILRTAVAGGIRMPDTYADTIYAWARETRSASWATLTADDLEEPVPDPSEEALQTYLDDHTDRFEVPETRAITYAWITPEMASETVEVSEDDLRAAYDARSAEFDIPERRLVERLVFPSDEAAADAAARLEAGEATFEDLVADRGLELADIDLGDVTEARLGAAGEAVFALDEPGVAGPVATDLGPALFRVNAILAAQTTSFEEATPQLRQELAGDAARREISDLFGPVDDLLAGGATLEEVADETGLELGQIDWRPGAEGGIADYAAFREAARSAEPGDYPAAEALEDGGIFALRVDEVRPPEVPALADIRDAVAEAWRTDETTARLVARAEEIAEAIRSGETLAGPDLDVTTRDGLTRGAAVDGAPEGLTEALFEMAEDEVRVVPGLGTATILTLNGIAAPDGDSDEAVQLKDQLTAEVSGAASEGALQAFVGAIEAREGVDVNRNAMTAVGTQLP